MRFPIAFVLSLLAVPAFAQTSEPTDWQGMAASLQQQLMEVIGNRMQSDAKMLRELHAASTEAAAAKAKLAEIEKRATHPSPAPAAPTMPATPDTK